MSREAVRKAVAEGRVSLIDGRIDPIVADVQWSTNTRARADAGKATTDTGKVVAGAAAGKQQKGDEGEGYWGARSRREEAEAIFRRYDPRPRLVIVGGDPIALATARGSVSQTAPSQ